MRGRPVPVDAGASWVPLCGKKDQNEQRIGAAPHLAQFGTNFALDGNDDDSCTYNERCEGRREHCLMDIADCVFAQSCGVNPAPNDCIADVGRGEGCGQCKDFNADFMCDDNTQVCAYTKADGGTVCRRGGCVQFGVDLQWKLGELPGNGRGPARRHHRRRC